MVNFMKRGWRPLRENKESLINIRVITGIKLQNFKNTCPVNMFLNARFISYVKNYMF